MKIIIFAGLSGTLRLNRKFDYLAIFIVREVLLKYYQMRPFTDSLGKFKIFHMSLPSWTVTSYNTDQKARIPEMAIDYCKFYSSSLIINELNRKSSKSYFNNYCRNFSNSHSQVHLVDISLLKFSNGSKLYI